MKKRTVVEVLLGKPIDVHSERNFLARLQRDLRRLGLSARILANLQVGRDGDRQVDFVVITAQRTIVVELKTFSGPVLSGPRNGRWRVSVGAGESDHRRNPLDQALGASRFFSDELHDFGREADVRRAEQNEVLVGPGRRSLRVPGSAARLDLGAGQACRADRL
jgi:hypothetical protein